MRAVPSTAPMTLVTARHERASLVWVIGELDELTVGTFEAEARRIGSHSRFLIIELSSCSFLSSAGLRALGRLQRRLPGAMALVTDNGQFEKLFNLAGLGHLVPRFTSVVDALAANDDGDLWSTFLSSTFASMDSSRLTAVTGSRHALRINQDVPLGRASDHAA